MPHLQPTVRQLQPLGRPDHSAAMVRVSVPARPRWRRWLTARPSPSA